MIIKRPGESPRAPKARGLSAREQAVKAAIEKSLAPYIDLSCGHRQTVETTWRYSFDVLHSVFDKSLLIYCEKCDDFVSIVKRKKSKPLPDVPLF